MSLFTGVFAAHGQACLGFGALGKSTGERTVESGPVLYLAGANDDDVRMRWIAMAQQLGFDLDPVDVYFIPGVFKRSQMQERIGTEIEEIGDVTLIIVDTSSGSRLTRSRPTAPRHFSRATESSIIIEVPRCRPVNRMRAVHPGEILREDFLAPLGMSVNALAMYPV